ncbi:reverse transcriptase domain-containing protein [Tanacetum coccineum]|uniref:Reverse transcriptase domain-containing protein n=1 Tax=Tanacetum coccineum TaxID=301880 RepID=A0ABQ5J575_9ASTR
MKDAKFDFSDDCKKVFNILKEKLTTTPIIISRDLNVPFELMCDASDFAVGAVLGQRIDGKFKLIYYANKTLNNAQEHYLELLVVVFSFNKFRPYLILSKTIVYTDHSAFEVFGAENLAVGHLSRLENPNLGTFAEEETVDKFPDEHLMILKTELNEDEPWYADYVNYIVGKIDNIMRRCVARDEIREILTHYHSGPTRGHHSASITGRKVYETRFFWPSIFKDAKDYLIRRDACQRSGNISSRSEMPRNNIQMERTKTPGSTRKKTKKWHDSRLRGDKNFKVGDKVFLFNSRFKMHPGKLKSRWYRPNVVKAVYPYGTIEIIDRNGISFKVNGQRLKKYHDEHTDAKDKEVVEFEEDTTKKV